MTPEERIEDALRQIGRDVKPPTGWQDRVRRRTVDRPSRVTIMVAVGLTVLVVAVVVVLLAVSP